jgi:uncharacterized protein YecE (DUF72 family)
LPVRLDLQTMQDALFPEDAAFIQTPAKLASPAKKPLIARFKNTSKPAPQQPDAADLELAAALPAKARLGTSSWNFPGWNGLVWDGEYAESQLSKHGLAAYAEHPLFRTVSLDRAFYRALTASQYAAYSSQVGDDFRFVVKAPALVTDATIRTEKGHAIEANPAFFSPELAASEFAQPALQGLRHKLGALVFQVSPLPAALQGRMPDLLQKLALMLQALPALADQAPDAVVAVEVRDPIWLTPEFAAVLRASKATYCLGLHPKMPPIQDQLPLLRALWPGPLVCRWNLHRMHGTYGFEAAGKRYAPYNRLVDEDIETRATLARVVNATTKAGYNVYVTANNNAEGSAPLSIAALAGEIAGRLRP